VKKSTKSRAAAARGARKTYDVAIVGGGIIGAAVAWELAAEKLRVVILERGEPGREASWAAAGMLAPGMESADETAKALAPLAVESFRLYPEFVAAVQEESGAATDFVREGTVEVFTGASSENERDRAVEQNRALGVAIEAVSIEQARRLEPALGPGAKVAAWLKEEATVDPRLLVKAVLAAAECRGVEIRSGVEVTSVVREGGRCTGVVAGGKRIAAGHVVVAAGSFSAATVHGVNGTGTKIVSSDWLARYVQTHPVRGQMVALRPPTVKMRRVLRSAKGYLVPRRDGRIIAGSTLENAGFAKHVTPAGVRGILDAGLELAPALGDAEIVETWAGLRPGTPDGLPILGKTDVEGVVIATGHYRNGILLAPVTGKLVRDWVLGAEKKLAASVNAQKFSPLRFGDGRAKARGS
jgi:glycine oxidase